MGWWGWVEELPFSATHNCVHSGKCLFFSEPGLLTCHHNHACLLDDAITKENEIVRVQVAHTSGHQGGELLIAEGDEAGDGCGSVAAVGFWP